MLEEAEDDQFSSVESQVGLVPSGGAVNALYCFAERAVAVPNSFV
jgi:hypothetical protein